MDRFRELTTFVAVAEEGAFNGAARRLGSSPPAVTRLITALEERLGVRLFTRTTRQVTLTEAGARLREDARRIMGELAEAESLAAGAQATASGHLRLTAPVMFGQRFIAPLLCDYLDAHPTVSASALFIDRNVNLLDEGIDVALRIGELPDSSLSAARIGAVRRVIVAAPDYVKRKGVAASPEALKDHRVIFPTSIVEIPSWSFVAGNKRRQVRLAPALSLNTMEAAIDAALAGWGITSALSYQVADDLAEGRLVELLGDFEDRIMPIHLLHGEGRQAAAKIRSFVDFAAEGLRGEAERLLAR